MQAFIDRTDKLTERTSRPAAEVVPETVEAYRRSRGRPAGSNKQSISLRLDKDVIEHFRATGPGWQARINDALKASFAPR